MGRDAKSKGEPLGRFVGLPHKVVDCPAFIGLSGSAVKLMIDLTRQYSGKNNGRLLCTLKVLKVRGWNSNDTLHRARSELENALLIQRTREALMPRRAAWYALCWRGLDYDPAMDIRPYEFMLDVFMLSESEKQRRVTGFR